MLKIIADSTCDLSLKEAKELGVEIIPMKVLIDDVEYISGVNLSPEEFYEKLAVCKKFPQTSLISAYEYQEKINPLLEKGDEVFVMCLSSGLSSSFENLQKVSAEINKPNLQIYDTKAVTFAYRALVYEAVKLSKTCKNAKELKEKMQNASEKLRLLAVVDTVKYLVKGGRLSITKGLAATALNLKPILTFKDGKLDVVAKGIGYASAVKSLIKEIKSIDETKPIYFGHTNDIAKLAILKKAVNEKFDVKNSDTSIVGPVIGAHAGPGCAGIVYFEA